MRLAYLIQVADDLAMFERMVKHIYNPKDFFCVNVDPRAGQQTHDSVLQTLHTVAGHPLPESVVVTGMETLWEGISHVDSALLMMRILLDMSNHNAGGQWSYLVTLDDTHYPLKSRDGIVEHLALTPHRNFISADDAYATTQALVERFKSSAGTGPDLWPVDGMDFRSGSEWFVLSHGFVADVVEHLGSSVTGKVLESQFRTVDSPLRPYRLVKLLLTNMLHPMRSFFLMCLLNGPFAETWVDDDLRVQGQSCWETVASDAPPPPPSTCTLFKSPNQRHVERALAEPSRLFGGDFSSEHPASVELVDFVDAYLADPPKRKTREHAEGTLAPEIGGAARAL